MIKNKLRAMRLMFIETPDADANAGGGSTPPTGEVTPKDKANEPLGEAGLKALQAEREQRKALAAELASVKAQLDKQAINQPKDTAAEIAEIRAQLEVSRLEATRERLARQHGLSDEHAALLEGDDTRMAALAAAFSSLKPTGGKLPDPFAGGAGADTKPKGTLQSGRDLAAKFKAKK